MKKIITAIMLIFSTFLIVGCSNVTTVAPTTTTKEVTPSQTTSSSQTTKSTSTQSTTKETETTSTTKSSSTSSATTTKSTSGSTTTKAQDTEPGYERVEISINPSIELMINENDVVVAVYAFNEDAEIVLTNETIKGLKIDAAIAKIVELNDKLGYLVKDATGALNEIKIYVSGEVKRAQDLYNDIKDSVESYLEENDLETTIKNEIINTKETIKAQIKEAGVKFEKAVEDMTESEINAALVYLRSEYEKFGGKEYLDMFIEAKAQEIHKKTVELVQAEVAKVKAGLGVVKQGYIKVFETTVNTVNTTYLNASNALIEAQYNYLIDPECDYQIALQTVLEKKAELLEKKNEIYEIVEEIKIEKNETLKATKEQTLEGLQAAYDLIKTALDTAQAALTTAANAAESAIALARTALNTVKSTIDGAINSLVNKVSEYVTNFDAYVNLKIEVAKIEAEYITTFIAEHKDDIDLYKETLLAIKNSILNIVE